MPEENRVYKICQLTDLHFGQAPFNEKDCQTLKKLDTFFKKHHSYDLVMITGDLMWGKQVISLEATLAPLYNLLNQYDFLVAVTYGNHDTESSFNITNVRDTESLIAHPALKLNSRIMDNRECYSLLLGSHAVYVWDSGAYSHWLKANSQDLYAAIEPEEVQWFLDASASRSSENVDVGFLHIPLPEYHQAIQNKFDGIKGEEICSPITNSGLFYALRRQGNVKAVFAGHDHYNNFDSVFQGIGLNYGNVTGYNCDSNLSRGVKEILISDKITTEIITF
ncbi:metallophosphoesterase [Lentilactobacillus raoultii]|uniref:Metallophosphoesterase n=1 Tax=Lentilactobacillus raoultii TaxID=1987503 RepID=A0ABW3PFR5_9LACO|nr:metallophosphoesterase [Lentilactobacillus raoultii]